MRFIQQLDWVTAFSIIITILMKHLPLESILRKRKSLGKVSRDNQPQRTSPLPINQPLNFSQLNSIVDSVKSNIAIPNETKVSLLQLIYKKTDTRLNKNIVLPHMYLKYCKHLQDLTTDYFHSQQSYFLLQGQINIYQEGEYNDTNFNTQPFSKKFRPDQYDEDVEKQSTFQEFQKHHPSLKVTQELNIFSSIGPVFSEKVEKQKKTRVMAMGAVLIVFKNIEDNELLHTEGILYGQKLELINEFPVLKLVGKKLMSFVNNFNLKNFNFKDVIYKKGDKPQSVYFIIEGNVSFELLLDGNSEDKHNSINVCTISSKNYFGQEEIIFKKTSRSHTAKVISSSCLTLQLSRDKFQKLLENPQFNDLILKTTKLKQLERLSKTQKMKKFLLNKKQQQNKKEVALSKKQLEQHTQPIKTQNKRRFSTFKGSSQKVKIMHGNLIHQVPMNNQKINFSMLEVNPDHFEQTKDKYRQYFIKKPQNVPPDYWNFKKLWKILNLEEILSENEIDINNNEGKKFFETHRRFKNQLLQSKSVRPKTTSSTYRTKIQYIAYLQQFNH